MMSFTMNKIYLLILFCCATHMVFASAPPSDTIVIPIQRQLFHDKIEKEQILIDKFDGKTDATMDVGNNEEINLQLTDALFRRVKLMAHAVERSSILTTNNDKVRHLTFI